MLARYNPQYCLGKLHVIKAQIAELMSCHTVAYQNYVLGCSVLSSEGLLREHAMAKELPLNTCWNAERKVWRNNISRSPWSSSRSGERWARLRCLRQSIDSFWESHMTKKRSIPCTCTSCTSTISNDLQCGHSNTAVYEYDDRTLK
jgi:hypothetical protein